MRQALQQSNLMPAHKSRYCVTHKLQRHKIEISTQQSKQLPGVWNNEGDRFQQDFMVQDNTSVGTYCGWGYCMLMCHCELCLEFLQGLFVASIMLEIDAYNHASTLMWIWNALEVVNLHVKSLSELDIYPLGPMLAQSTKWACVQMCVHDQWKKPSCSDIELQKQGPLWIHRDACCQQNHCTLLYTTVHYLNCPHCFWLCTLLTH